MVPALPATQKTGLREGLSSSDAMDIDSPRTLETSRFNSNDYVDYYWGIPSNARLVGRSGFFKDHIEYIPEAAQLAAGTGRAMKHINALDNDCPLIGTWPELEPILSTAYDEYGVGHTITCMDICKLGFDKEGKGDPVVVWIGVVPLKYEVLIEGYKRPSGDVYCWCADHIRVSILEKFGSKGLDSESFEVEFREAIPKNCTSIDSSQLAAGGSSVELQLQESEAPGTGSPLPVQNKLPPKLSIRSPSMEALLPPPHLSWSLDHHADPGRYSPDAHMETLYHLSGQIAPILGTSVGSSDCPRTYGTWGPIIKFKALVADHDLEHATATDSSEDRLFAVCCRHEVLQYRDKNWYDARPTVRTDSRARERMEALKVQLLPSAAFEDLFLPVANAAIRNLQERLREADDELRAFEKAFERQLSIPGATIDTTEGTSLIVPDDSSTYGHLSDRTITLDDLRNERDLRSNFQVSRPNSISEIQKWMAMVKTRIDKGQLNIGKLIFSPPISKKKKDQHAGIFYHDLALVELFPDSVNAKNFAHNVIDFRLHKYTDIQSIKEEYEEAKVSYPSNNRLQISGIINREELDECMRVIKAGAATGVTVGVANPMSSLIRRFVLRRSGVPDEITEEHSFHAWCIPIDSGKSRIPFASTGDSGAVVANLCGEWGGMLIQTCEAADEVYDDFAYALPACTLKDMLVSKNFPDIVLP